MIIRALQIIKAVAQGRSAKWPKIRKAFLAAFPLCEACGTGKKLEVHHIESFANHPDLELKFANLMTLCRRDHAFIGHCNDFKLINVHATQDAVFWRGRIEEAKRKG